MHCYPCWHVLNTVLPQCLFLWGGTISSSNRLRHVEKITYNLQDPIHTTNNRKPSALCEIRLPHTQPLSAACVCEALSRCGSRLLISVVVRTEPHPDNRKQAFIRETLNSSVREPRSAAVRGRRPNIQESYFCKGFHTQVWTQTRDHITHTHTHTHTNTLEHGK